MRPPGVAFWFENARASLLRVARAAFSTSSRLIAFFFLRHQRIPHPLVGQLAILSLRFRPKGQAHAEPSAAAPEHAAANTNRVAARASLRMDHMQDEPPGWVHPGGSSYGSLDPR